MRSAAPRKGSVGAEAVRDVEMWWWAGLAAVVLLSLLTALVDGGGRLARRRRARAAGRRPAGPRPGEVWWAGAPDPVLVVVLAVRGARARVAQLTTDAASPPVGADALVLPGPAADGPAPHVARVRADGARELPAAALRRPLGALDADAFARVRRLSGEPAETGESDQAGRPARPHRPDRD